MRVDFADECPPELESDCLQNFLSAIPRKYPETHDVWNKADNKFKLVSYLVRAIRNFNVRNFYAESKNKYNASATTTDSDGNEVKQTKLRLQDYPWLMKFAMDLLKDNQRCTDSRDRKRYRDYKRALRQLDPELYQSFIDKDPELINDVETFDALYLLKHDRNKVLAKWKLYLNTCREKLRYNSKSVKHFVSATKWHQDIPIKFVKQCLLEIEEKGSTLVLGILLEGNALGKVIQPYLPKDEKIDLEDEDAKKAYDVTSSLPKAMNFANPPVSFDVISAFCQGDYVTLATNTLTNVAQRVPVSRVLAFANQLVCKPISVRKLGIRLVFQVASKAESREFLSRTWAAEKNSSLREVLAKMIFDVFRQTPSADTWELVKICIDGLTVDDQVVFDALADVSAVDKSFVTQYIQEYLKKVDAFGQDELDEDTKSKLICSLVKSIDANILHLLPEDLVTNILKRHFFEYSTNFRVDVYLFSDAEKFEERLKTFMEILREKYKEYNKPHAKNPRYYPANYQLRCFFREMVRRSYSQTDFEMSTKLINVSLALLSTLLKPWQEPTIFILLNVAKDYFETSTPKEFGARFAGTAVRFVKEFGSEMILNEIAEYMAELLRDSEKYAKINKQALKLTVIEGLSEVDVRLGGLIGIKLLNYYEIEKYDDRYDALIKSWSAMEDTMVQAVLYDFLNEVHDS